MPPPSTKDATPVQETKLPRRDWILLPVLCLLTLLGTASAIEWVARRVFSESKTGLGSCLIFDDPTTGVRARPNSVCMEKAPEVPWVEYRFNGAGYRSEREFAPKQPGVYRIVITGSSVVLGERVNQEQSMAALLPRQLTNATGHPVELLNEGMGFGYTHNTALRFNDVLKTRPDLILWVLTPGDVQTAAFVLPPANPVMLSSMSFVEKVRRRWKAEFGSRSFPDAISELFSRTRTATLLRHFLYESRSQYLKSYLTAGDDVDFLRAGMTPEWQKRMRMVDSDAATMEARARAAGIPFAAVLVPQRGQAALLSMGEWPPDLDPFGLDNQLRRMIEAHGGIYIDILPDYRNLPHPEDAYLPVDGHPNAAGQAMIATLLTRELTTGVIPALKARGNAPLPISPLRDQ
jgi:hypothetical protein